MTKQLTTMLKLLETWQRYNNQEFVHYTKLISGWKTTIPSEQKQTCPHCKNRYTSFSMRRWHGAECHKNTKGDDNDHE